MSESTPPTNFTAPTGFLWVCSACGKRSEDQYGFKSLDYGWDESCTMNCTLVRKGTRIDLPWGRSYV